jgi:segregation and condensation protein A
VVGFQTDAIRVDLPEYEGPLDLLLDLIERSELEITRLALASVTDQYLARLHSLPDLDAAEVSAFLVIAAKLVQIKSEALLPRPPEREPGEEDPAEALARQLILYRRFKQISVWLGQREEQNLHTFLRLAPPVQIEGKLDLSGVTLQDLILAARSVYLPEANRPLLSTVVSIPLVTIRNKIQAILRVLRERGETSFTGMLAEGHSRVEIVVTFLALLELVKRHYVETDQSGLFAEIQIHRLDELVEFDSFDLDLQNDGI